MGAGCALAGVALVAGAPARAASAGEVFELQLQSCPQQEFLRAGESSQGRREAALEGRFEPSPGQPAKLTPPIDWHQDPYDNRTWVFRLHALDWLNPLLDLYAEHGNAAALATARDIALDWIAHVPPGDESFSPLAWEAKTAGDRVGRLAYLTRAAACEDLLSNAQAGSLIDSLREHGERLATPTHHPLDNHGLFADYGLALIAFHLPFLSEATAWQGLAEARYAELIERELAPESGLYLEHSPNYPSLAVLRTQAFARVAPGATLAPILARLRASAGWFVMPGRTLVPLGDSAPGTVPRGSWLDLSAGGTTGLFPAFDAGLGIVKLARSYLAVTAWHHPFAHHHGDDLGFHLREGTADVVSDSGYHSYEYTGLGQFARTSDAHSVLTVDSRRFSLEADDAYGSGLRAAGQGDGWYGLAGVSPALRPQRVWHRRLFLYRPGSALVIIDRVRARRPHRYTRRFQVAPSLWARPEGPGWRLEGPGSNAFLDPGPGARGMRRLRGRLDPLAGWMFPAFLEAIPRWTLVTRTRARNADLVTVIGLRGRLEARMASPGRGRLLVSVRKPGREGIRLAVTQRGQGLRIAQRPVR